MTRRSGGTGAGKRFISTADIRFPGVSAMSRALCQTATALLRALPLSLLSVTFLEHGGNCAETAPNLLLTYSEAYYLAQPPGEKELIAQELESGLVARFPPGSEPAPFAQYLVAAGAQCIVNIPIDEPEKPTTGYCLYDYVGTTRTAAKINQMLVTWGIQITNKHGDIDSISVRVKDLQIPKP